MLSGELSIGGADLAWAAITDIGNSRALNEDAMLAAPPVFLVADGMGGHDAGEVASSLTVERFRNFEGEGPISVDAVAAELQNVNALLQAASTGNPESGMGTTGVGLALVDNGGIVSWLVFNVGDSRLYSYADSVLTQVSHDHSYVQELVDVGEIDEAAARTHPQRNVVTQAIGVGSDFRPDYWVRPLRPRERFLLCSDGLSGEIDDGVIETVLAAGRSLEDTARELVDLALASGGRDNVTTMLVEVLAVEAFDDFTTDTQPGRARAATGTAVLDAPTSRVDTVPAPIDPVPQSAAAPVTDLHAVVGTGEVEIADVPVSSDQVDAVLGAPDPAGSGELTISDVPTPDEPTVVDLADQPVTTIDIIAAMPVGLVSDESDASDASGASAGDGAEEQR